MQRMSRALAEVTDMRCVDVDDITPHYAETLKRWRQRFLEKRSQIQRLGFSDRFVRMWEFYFCYCEGGFLERRIGDVQLLLAKPEHQSATTAVERTNGAARWTLGR